MTILLLPWWIYLCIVGIIYSGYMTFKTAKQDRKIDEEFIEKEGQVFIERIEEERKKKQGVNEHTNNTEDDPAVL
ncbi:sporulation YhaL family protein [Metabacillus fastidiosus]|uniref:sporulation YhaL family protein n=1 Tax=Metabacillus fastidiosus TaxID=1458 RepID=UPI00399C7040